MVSLRRRTIKDFLNHFYHFILFCDKRKILLNILNFFRAFLNRNKAFEFYLENGKKLILNYLGLIRKIYLESCKSFLLAGEIRSDANDYKKFNIDFRNKIVLDFGASRVKEFYMALSNVNIIKKIRLFV